MSVIYGIILAGGRGARMQNQDKGLLQAGGIMLIQHVINALSPQVSQILISANRNIDEYDSLGFKVIRDDLEGFAGPLAGICRAMEESEKSQIQPDYVAVVPCDAPLFPGDLVNRLQAEYTSDDILAVIPHDGSRLQPLFGLYSIKALASLKAYLAGGNRKVSAWVESLPHRIVDFSDKGDVFLNINTASELDAANNLIVKAD